MSVAITACPAHGSDTNPKHQIEHANTDHQTQHRRTRLYRPDHEACSKVTGEHQASRSSIVPACFAPYGPITVLRNSCYDLQNQARCLEART
jgi:hypothetical protein